MTLSRTLLAAALLAAPPAGIAAAEPTPVGNARMTVPAKQGVLHVLVEANLTKDAAFKPVSIAPDLWYGATDKLTLGLVHSGRAASGFIGGIGDGLCLTGEDNNCAKVYDGVGLLARYHLEDGAFTVAADGGLLVGSFDPFTLGLKAGIAGRWQNGKVALDIAPNLYIGLNERDGAVGSAGNKERINIPVGISYAVAPSFALGAQSGLTGPIEDLSDNLVLPFSIGAEIIASDHLLIDLAFSLPLLVDNNDATESFDIRTLTLGVGYAF